MRRLSIFAAFLGALLALAACAKKDGLRVEKTLKVGAEPEFLALSEDGKRLGVSCSRSNDVWILDLEAGLSQRIDTEPRPAGLRFESETGRILVAESDEDTLAQISLGEGRVTRRFKVLPQPERLLPMPGSSARSLITSLSQTGFGVFRGSSLRPEKLVLLEGFVQKLVLSKDGKELLAVTRDSNAFVRVRLADLSPQWSLSVQGTPVDMALSDDGKFAWVAGAGKYYDGAEEEKSPEPGGLSCVRLADSRVVDSALLCPGAAALSLSHSGQYLYVLCQEEDELQVFDTATLLQKASLPLHGSPGAFVLSADGRRLYVCQRDLKQVSVVLTGIWR